MMGGGDGDRELTEGARTSKPHYFRSGTGSASASEGSLTDDCVHLFVTPTVLGLFIHLLVRQYGGGELCFGIEVRNNIHIVQQ